VQADTFTERSRTCFAPRGICFTSVRSGAIMSGLEPIAIALAGPMGKLAWAGIKQCWVRYRKHKANTASDVDDTDDVVGMELDREGRNIGELYDRYANRLGPRFVQGDCKCSSILRFRGKLAMALLLTSPNR